MAVSAGVGLAVATAGMFAVADDSAAPVLKRGGAIGVQVGPLEPEQRKNAGLEDGAGGLSLMRIMPGSAAEAAGLKAGDVLVRVDGEAVSTAGAFVATLSKKREGDTLKVAYRRDGKEQDATVTLKSRPVETSDQFEVEYGAVESRGARLRSIVLKPKASDVKHPALLIIQGLGCASLDNAPNAMSVYRRICEAFAAEGFVTMRVDKPGCGDSEGGPCDKVDFNTELDGYRQALKALKGRSDVDPDRVLIFGHSMGGVFGPLVAGDVPVKGVAVYGTVVKTWPEYVTANVRRQEKLAGMGMADIDRSMRLLNRLNHEMFTEDKTPEQIAKEAPDLAAAYEAQGGQGEQLYGRFFRFFQQLDDVNMPEAWEKANTNVLALYGESDFVTEAEDHRWIAEIANSNRAGSGEWKIIEDADHGFATAETPEAAFAQLQGGGGNPTEMNPAVIATLLAWAKRIAPVG